MKQIIKVEKEVNITTLEVNIIPVYWDETVVDGDYDTESGDKVPCKEGDRWKPIIDIDKGIITNWKQGKTAGIFYDAFNDSIYTLKDEDGNIVTEKTECVPSIMRPDRCYREHINMSINASGVIENWNPDLSDFFEEE